MSFISRLFVWKDDREATTSQIVKVLQDLDGDNLFANLDNLLNSGDTSAALYVLGHFTAGLNDGGEEEEVGKIDNMINGIHKF